MNAEYMNSNPFQSITDSCTEEANLETNLIDLTEDENGFINNE